MLTARSAEAEPPAQEFLLPCAVCGRTFRPESLQKHSRVCERNATKKRKIFDSSKQRIQGTELAEFLPTLHMQQAKKAEKCRTTALQKSQWKEKHLEFMRAIRAARKVEKPLSPRASAVLTRPPESERCPHCDRQFGPKAFDRHIEWCREQKARMPKSPATIKAKERLEARLKYRAPVSRRISIREKYSPQTQRKMSDTSVHNSTDAIHSKNQTASSVPPNSGQRDTSVPRQNLVPTDTQWNRSNNTNKRSSISAKKISQRSESDVKKSPNTGVKSAISERKQISSQTNKTKAKKDEKTIINNRGFSRGKRPATSVTKPAESSKSTPQPNKTEKDNVHSNRTIPRQKYPVPSGNITSALQVLALDTHGEYLESPNIERFNSVSCKSDAHVTSINLVDYSERKLNDCVILNETTAHSKSDGTEKQHLDQCSSYLKNKNKVEMNLDTDSLYLGIHENGSENPNPQLPHNVNGDSEAQIKCETTVNSNEIHVNDSAMLPITFVEATAEAGRDYLHLDLNEQFSEHQNLQLLCSVNCKSDECIKGEPTADCTGSKVLHSEITPMTDMQDKANINCIQHSNTLSHSLEYGNEVQKMVKIDNIHCEIHEGLSMPPNEALCKSSNNKPDEHMKYETPLDCKLNDSAVLGMTHIQTKANVTNTRPSESYSSFSENEKEMHRNNACRDLLNSSLLLTAPSSSIDSFRVTEKCIAKQSKKMFITKESPNILLDSGSLTVTSENIVHSQENLNSCNEIEEYLNVNAVNYVEQSASSTHCEVRNKSLTVSTIPVEGKCESKDNNIVCDDVYEHNKIQEKALHGISVEEQHHDTMNATTTENPSSMARESNVNISQDAVLQKEELDNINIFSEVPPFHYTDSLSFNHISASDCNESLTHNDLKSSEMRSHKYQLIKHRSVPDLSMKLSPLHFKKSKSFTNYSSMRELVDTTPDNLKFISHCAKNDDPVLPCIFKVNGFNCIHTNNGGVNKSDRTEPWKCVKFIKKKHVFNIKKNIGLRKRNCELKASSLNNIKHNIKKIVKEKKGIQSTTVSKEMCDHLFKVNKIKYFCEMFMNCDVVLKISTRKGKDLSCNQKSSLNLQGSSDVHSENSFIVNMDKLEILMIQQKKETISNEERSNGLSLSCPNNNVLNDEKEPKETISNEERSNGLSLSCPNNNVLNDEKEPINNRNHSEEFYTSVSNKDSEKVNYKHFIALEVETLETNITYQGQGHRNHNNNNDKDKENKDLEICYSSVSQNNDRVYTVTASRDLYENVSPIVSSPGKEVAINQSHSVGLVTDNVKKESEYSSEVHNSRVTQTTTCSNTKIKTKVSGLTGKNKHYILSPRNDNIPVVYDGYDCTTDISHDSLCKSNETESKLQPLYADQPDGNRYLQAEDSSFHNNSLLLEMAKNYMISEQHNETLTQSTDNINEVFTDDGFISESHSNTSQVQDKSFVNDFINTNVVTDYPEKPCSEENNCELSVTQLCHNVNAQENEHRICLECVNEQLHNGLNGNSSTAEQQLIANNNVNNSSRTSLLNYQSLGNVSDRNSSESVLCGEENSRNSHTKRLPSLLPHLKLRQTEQVKCENSLIINYETNKIQEEHDNSSTYQDIEYIGSLCQDHHNENETWKNEHRDPKVRANSEIASHCGNKALYNTYLPAELQLPKIVTTGYRANDKKNVKELTIMKISKKCDKLKCDRNPFISKIPRHVPNIQCLNTTVRQQCLTQDRNKKPNKLPPLKRCSLEKSRPDPNISGDALSLSVSDSHVSRKLFGELDCKSEFGEEKKADEALHPNSQMFNAEDYGCCKDNVINKKYSAMGKHSVDSAYSSLNRQSSKQDVQEQDHCNTISSSGSESSLPTLSKEEELRPGTGDTVILSHNQDHKKEHHQGANLSQQPKFCHECGAQYPVTEAKFCCECGVRRLVI